MESQQPSSSSSAAAETSESPPGILLLEELKQCNQMMRQLMNRKEKDDKTLKCLRQYLEMWHNISQSDELKQKDADNKIEEGQQQKLQFQKQMGQKGIEMIRMIKEGQQKLRNQLDELTLFEELMWQRITQMARKKSAGRRLPNELCAELVKAMPLTAKLTLNEKLDGTKTNIGQYIQEGLNKLSITSNNCWDEDDCYQVTLSDDQLTATYTELHTTHKGLVGAKLPIPNCADGIFYFENFVREGDHVNIGLCTGPVRDIDTSVCSYSADGDLWVDDESFDHIFGAGPGFVAGDWVGCGVHLATRQMFFTRNGTFLGIATTLPAFAEPIDVFPALDFINQDTIVETNFGRQPFQWKCSDADLATMMRRDGPTHLGEADKARLAQAMTNWN